MNYKQKINELCPFNIQCKSDDCQLLHPRIFAGICILHLQGKCPDGDQCLLKHKSKGEINQLLKMSKINGVYSFNLCSKQKNCELASNCRFLHRQWAENVCLQDIEDECENRETCKLNHLSWDKLKKEAYKQYNIYELNPEEFQLGKVHSMLTRVCQDYLSGECPLQTSCLKEHIDWEDLRSCNVEDLQELRRKPCTNFYSISIYKQAFEENDTVNQFFQQIHIKQIEKEVKHSNVVDVLFIMDCTGSMQKWLDSAKQNIIKIIEEFQQYINSPQTLVRTAFVGYRDFEDEENIFYREFTPNSQIILDFIKNQQAIGGGDIPEDVIGGLNKGLQLNISRHPDSVLCTFLICDSPSHGRPYHNIIKDYYNDRVMEGELESIMNKYEKIKKKSFFTCFKITDTTDIMFEKMKDGFKNLSITQTTSDGLKEAVLFSLQNSLYKSQIMPSRKQTQKKIRATFEKNLEQLILEQDTINDSNYWKYFEAKFNLYRVRGQTLLLIKQEQITLSEDQEGTQCKIFELFDVANNRNLIVKLPNFVIEKYLKKECLTTNEIKTYEQMIQIRYVSLSLAQRLAYSFRQKTKHIQNAPPLFFVSPIIYDLDEPFYGVNQIYAETRIDLPNSIEWTKFTNNTKYVNQDFDYYTSFSHFVYQETGKQLIITDLQGQLNILSDPAIHTVDDELTEKIFNDGINFQQEGINNFFFHQHKNCNQICNELNLEGSLNYETKSDSKIWNKRPDDFIYTICDSCGNIEEQLYQEYLEQNNTLCQNCKNENNEIIKLTCTCCSLKFDCAYNLCIRKNEIPQICDQCRIRCKFNENNNCYYCECYCEIRLQKVQIENQILTLCKESIRYLRAIKCQFCQELYDYSVLIDQNQYLNPYYVCKKCQ